MTFYAALLHPHQPVNQQLELLVIGCKNGINVRQNTRITLCWGLQAAAGLQCSNTPASTLTAPFWNGHVFSE
jgi:hypothetical protein